VVDGGFDHVIFLDAVEFGGAPGSVVLLDSEEMAARFPQVSTHKLSLGLLARQIETNGQAKAWLLGVQPESLRQGEQLSPTVKATLQLLLELMTDVSLVGRAVLCAPRPCYTPITATARRAGDCAPYQESPEVMA
jgi:hydrogenase 3 maturation protease